MSRPVGAHVGVRRRAHPGPRNAWQPGQGRPLDGSRRGAPGRRRPQASRRPAQRHGRPASAGPGAPTRPAAAPGRTPGEPRRRQPASPHAHHDGRGPVRLQHLRRPAAAPPGLRRLRGLQDAQPQPRGGPIVTPAMRGQILDRNGTILASSVERRTVTVDQTARAEVRARPVDGVAHRGRRRRRGAGPVAAARHPRRTQLVTEAHRHLRYRILAKNVTPLNWRKISELGIPGIYSRARPPTASTRRRRPRPRSSGSYRPTATRRRRHRGPRWTARSRARPGKHDLRAVPRTARAIPDAGRRSIPPVARQRRQAHHRLRPAVVRAERRRQQVNETKALSGTVVVQDVKTGKLLAVASYPTFDPNRRRQDRRRALDQQRVQRRLRAGLDRQGHDDGRGARGGRRHAVRRRSSSPTGCRRSGTEFKDSHDHPTEYLTVAGVLAQSSNIGTILAARR